MILNVIFKNESDFEEAKDWFDCMDGSQFYADEVNSEFRSIGFKIDDQFDADITEHLISQEINSLKISDYRFEIE